MEERDSALLADLWRRWLDEHAYFSWGVRHHGKGFLTLDGTIEVTPEEVEALNRIAGTEDGQGWWRVTEQKLQR